MLTSALAALALAAGPGAPAVDVPYELYRLPNGLTVILSEDHTAPVVGVDVMYHVGSKDERPGRTGFAHLFEHLMFEGSAHVPKGEGDRLVDAAGGSSNGGTRQDMTEYWEQVPNNALEQMLYVEADRMCCLLETIDQAKLDNQREVVKNERRQNYEMRPYGLAYEKLLAALWDPQFPYHWLPIGSMADLGAASLDDVKGFFRTYYGPQNASLAIAGDFDKARAKALVAKWFGSIPAGAPVKPDYPAPAPLGSEVRVTMEDRVQLPRLYLAWQTPKGYAPGDAALQMLGLVLASGKSARLEKRLVMDERIAQDVSAGQSGDLLAGTFLVTATPKPGVDPARLEREIDEELARIAKEGPGPDELTRAKNKVEAQMILGLESVGGFDGRAAMLNTYLLQTGDPGYFPKDLARYRAVTAEEVRDAAAKWLKKDARVVLTVTPKHAGPKEEK